MSEDQRQVEASQGGGAGVEGDTEPSMLLQKLKSNISKDVQTKVDQILQDVQRFSDNEKLYLYLQLPSGPSTGDKSVGDCCSFNTADQLHTCNWIRSHLEEHSDTCLPKQDVYETYRRYCEILQHRPLSAANFGKIIRDIFPNIKARRLGGRGQSKYCYSGIRRKTVLNMPLLPNLDLKNDPAELTELVQTYKQEVTEAACELICDWAQKILKRSFDTVVEIARYLIQEHIVNPRCSQAELVTSAALAGGPAKSHKVIKKTVISKADSEGAADHKKDFGDSSSSSSSLRPGDKSAAAVKPLDAPLPPSSSSSSSLRPAVEAFMKQLPRILPRSSLPDKTHLSVSSSPSLLAPPPSLAPKDPPGVGGASAPGGQVKVISMGGGALPVMILPQSVLTSAPPPPPQLSAPTSVLQKPRGQGSGVTKRPPSDPFPAPLPLKRKRGRPRKPRPEEAPPPLPPAVLSPKPPPPSHMPIITSVTGGVIQLLQSAPPPHWEIQGVIQKAPRPGNNMLAVPSAVLPPPTLHDDDQVEITLTPVELHLDTPTSYSSTPTSCSSLTVMKRREEEEGGEGGSKRQ